MAATAPLLRHLASIRDGWGSAILGVGITSVRPIAGTTTWSQHAYSNAMDIRAARWVLAAIAAAAASQARTWSVNVVIFNRRIWSARTQRWSTYNGENPHLDHVHIDYLPQWTGTPPGHPVGSPTDPGRAYERPPAVASPFGSGWLRAVATATFIAGTLPTSPDTATESQVREAVIAFNRAQGFAATPAVGSGTWDRLGSRSLRRGMTGRAVSGLQFFLRRYGFLVSTGVDGVFGPVTEQAVQRFQLKAKVAATGSIGANDWRALWWGPARWQVVGPLAPPPTTWTRPADGQPNGRIDHSWEATLRALTPRAGRSAASVAWVGRTIRSTIK